MNTGLGCRKRLTAYSVTDGLDTHGIRSVIRVRHFQMSFVCPSAVKNHMSPLQIDCTVCMLTKFGVSVQLVKLLYCVS